MKGYTVNSVLTNKTQLSEVAKYMSPMVVYEASHRSQNAWAAKAGIYKAHTQEDEIDAMASEALYMNEKTRSDASFSKLFEEARDYSHYADKRVNNARNYAQGGKIFSDGVRMTYADLPSLGSASANTLTAVNRELERRAAMSAGDREGMFTDITYSDLRDMTPTEISGAVGEIEEGALVRLRADLSNTGSYRLYYKTSLAKTRSDYQSLSASTI